MPCCIICFHGIYVYHCIHKSLWVMFDRPSTKLVSNPTEVGRKTNKFVTNCVQFSNAQVDTFKPGEFNNTTCSQSKITVCPTGLLYCI